MAIEHVVRDFRRDYEPPFERWWFSIGVRGCPPGEESEEWSLTLDEFKAAIPAQARTWHPSIKRWCVIATEANERRMREVFDNFDSCLAIVRSQLRLLI